VTARILDERTNVRIEFIRCSCENSVDRSTFGIVSSVGVRSAPIVASRCQLVRGQRHRAWRERTRDDNGLLAVPRRVIIHDLGMCRDVLRRQLRQFIRLRMNPAQRFHILVDKRTRTDVALGPFVFVFVVTVDVCDTRDSHRQVTSLVNELTLRYSCCGKRLGKCTVWCVPHCGGRTTQRISFTCGLSGGLTPYK
jgi:hypothetical protein